VVLRNFRRWKVVFWPLALRAPWDPILRLERLLRCCLLLYYSI
jgi:hypothetical protein